MTTSAIGKVDPAASTQASATQWPAPAVRYCDLHVRGACGQWRQIRWALFVFPDVTDVAPTDDPGVVRVYYQGVRAYQHAWTVELVQAGFDADLGVLPSSG